MATTRTRSADLPFRRINFSRGHAIRFDRCHIDWLAYILDEAGYTQMAQVDPREWYLVEFRHRTDPRRRVYIEIGAHERSGKWNNHLCVAHSCGGANARWIKMLPAEAYK